MGRERKRICSMLKLGFKSVPLLSETVSVLKKEFHIMESQCWISGEDREQRSLTNTPADSYVWTVCVCNLVFLVNCSNAYILLQQNHPVIPLK